LREVTLARPPIIVIGAGMGGLAASIALASGGAEVLVLERWEQPGGKLRPLHIAGAALDAGPTVFTMRWVFDELLAAAGTSLAAHLELKKAGTLARHAWNGGETLDLFADIDRSADAIGVFAGAAESRGYRAFCAQARAIYATLEHPFLRSARPTPVSLIRAGGMRGLGALWRINPFETMWHALGEHFQDARLRQLFGRYATYCGSSPFHAPATLMLVAHVEQDGVWLVQGGMHQIASALAGVARGQGVAFRFGAHVKEVLVQGGRAAGVVLQSGERIAASAIIANADAAAFAAGHFGADAVAASPAMPPATRSLSAVTWATVARADGFPLCRHNVFFSPDYGAEFADLFGRAVVPRSPTVYVCAQDRNDAGQAMEGAERLLCLINAPACGDATKPEPEGENQCTQRMLAQLARCGLMLQLHPNSTIMTGPAQFENLYPGTGGALYGQAVHGSMASFRRPGARSKLPGLYLAGGSTHPGAGVPMAALSGRLAAASLLADSVSTAPSRRTAMRGGMSMR
jgi:1-hydroxycarotenoid 3,4-desaturase